jgi:mercuric ion transport protein
MNAIRPNEYLLTYASLFGSLGTLLCCALPSLLVLFGLGATVASFLSAAPFFVMLSHHKNRVFAASAGLIVANFMYVYLVAPKLRARALACSPDDRRACVVASRVSRTILWISAAIYALGFLSAYVLGRLLVRFG